MAIELTLNSQYVTGSSFNIYNLSIEPIDAVSIHIEPKYFMSSIAGFNETTSPAMWLLEEKSSGVPKIKIRLDNSVTYNLSKYTQGSKVTNPIIYSRSNLSGHNIILTKDVSGSTVTVQPIYGSDQTKFGSDWIRTINSGDVSGYNTLPSSGNIITNKQYFQNHLFNSPPSGYNDYLKFEIIINADSGTEAALYNNILLALKNAIFIVKPAIYEKPLTSIYELMFSGQYIKYSSVESFGIRY